MRPNIFILLTLESHFPRSINVFCYVETVYRMYLGSHPGAMSKAIFGVVIMGREDASIQRVLARHAAEHPVCIG